MADMMRYPKIEGVFRRDEDHKITPEFKCSEFDLIKKFLMFEKIDGLNAQIKLAYPEVADENVPREVTVEIFNRNRKLNSEDKSGRPVVEALKETLKTVDFVEWYAESFIALNVGNPDFIYPEVRFFGEAYGPGIQKRGKIYRAERKSFILFDVHIGSTWLNWESVKEIGEKLSIPTVPEIMPIMIVGSSQQVFKSFREMLTNYSTQIPDAPGGEAEGFILRPEPMILNRHGQRLIFKIKRKDYGLETDQW